MPTLVAVRAAPRNACSASPPCGATSRAAPKPAANDPRVPSVATATAALPTCSTSRTVDSSPTSNSRMRTPSCDSMSTVRSEPRLRNSDQGSAPRSSPANSSPSTGGWRRRVAISPPTFAATSTTASRRARCATIRFLHNAFGYRRHREADVMDFSAGSSGTASSAKPSGLQLGFDRSGRCAKSKRCALFLRALVKRERGALRIHELRNPAAAGNLHRAVHQLGTLLGRPSNRAFEVGRLRVVNPHRGHRCSLGRRHHAAEGRLTQAKQAVGSHGPHIHLLDDLPTEDLLVELERGDGVAGQELVPAELSFLRRIVKRHRAIGLEA